MSDISYLEVVDIERKYLQSGVPYYDKGVTNPGWYGFYQPHSRYSNARIPSNTTNGYKHKDGAKEINFVILNENITCVGQGAFAEQNDLLVFDAKSSDGLALEKNAFKNCKNLYKICLPYGLNSLDKTAFYGCDKLSIVEIAAGEFDGRDVPRDKRHLFNPSVFNVINYGGYPYIYNNRDNNDKFYRVRKLATNVGQFQQPLICKRQHLSFSNVAGYPYFDVYGLGITEKIAEDNLAEEVKLIESAVNTFVKSKTFSPERIGAMVSELRLKKVR